MTRENPSIILTPVDGINLARVISMFDHQVIVDADDISKHNFDWPLSDILPASVGGLMRTSRPHVGQAAAGRDYTALIFNDWLNVPPYIRSKIVAGITAGMLHPGVWVVYVNTYKR